MSSKLHTVRRTHLRGKPFATGVDRINSNIFDGEQTSTTDSEGVWDKKWAPVARAGLNAVSQIKTGAPRGAWDTLDPVYHLAGGRESAAGNAMSDAGVALTKTGNPWLMLAGAGLKVVGGLTNAAWGTKENKANVGFINQGITSKRNTGRMLGAASTTGDLLSAAGRMTGGSGFGTGDLYRGGWFSGGKARRKAQALLDKENQALAFQNHALSTGANNVDQIQDSNIMRNFAAFGGPLITVDPSTPIGYSIVHSGKSFAEGGDTETREDEREQLENLMFYLRQKEKYPHGRKRTNFEQFLNYDLGIPERTTAPYFQDIELPSVGTTVAEKVATAQDIYNAGKKAVRGIGEATKNKVSTGEPYIPHLTFAEGGGLRIHGADFTNDMVHVNAGGSHEENPDEGVRMGVDPEGTPNLVEEGEVIYDDYVFSNRLVVPKFDRKDETQEAKMFRKYSGKTFAYTAKKIEKRVGADERIDDITQRGLDTELQLLAQLQEKEREKEKLQQMQDAIDQMSPEEFTAFQQQMQANQEQANQQAMQEQAMQEQIMQQPQQMEQQLSPEELAIMQQQQQLQEQQQMEQVPIMEQPIAAYGGNLFKYGGTLAQFDEDLQSNGLTRKDYFKFLHDSGKIDDITYKNAIFSIDHNQGDLYLNEQNFNKDLAGLFMDSLNLGPIQKVLQQNNNMSIEDWSKLADKQKRGLINNYKRTLSPEGKQEFQQELDTFNQQQEYKRQVAEHQRDNINSHITKEDLKDYDINTLNRIASRVNAQYTPIDVKGMSSAEKQESKNKLIDNISKWSKDNNVTIGDINESFQSPNMHLNWRTTNWDDKDSWSTTKGYDYDEFSNRVKNYKGSLTPGNTEGKYAPDANPDKDVFGGFDDIEALQNDADYQAYTEAGKKVLKKAREKGVKWGPIKTDENGNTSQEVINKDALTDDEYSLLKAISEQGQRTSVKNGTNTSHIGIFNTDKDGHVSVSDNAEDLFNYARNDDEWGAMHLFPRNKDFKSRDLYTVKGNLYENEPLYHTLSQIEDANADWKNYYDISEPVVKDGTNVYTLTPKQGIHITRADQLPEGIQKNEDGTYSSVDPSKKGKKGTDEDDILNGGPYWPYWLAGGLQAAALGYNLFSSPDYSNADAMINAASEAGQFRPVEFRPRPNYLTYNPMDIWYGRNMLNADYTATDRNLANNAAPISTQLAARVGNAHKNAIAQGNLYRQGLEYNDANRRETAKHNEGVDEFISSGYLKADMANQEAAARARGYQLEGLKAGYTMKQAIDDARSSAISAGLTGLGNLAMTIGQNQRNAKLWKYYTDNMGAHGGKLRKRSLL